MKGLQVGIGPVGANAVFKCPFLGSELPTTAAAIMDANTVTRITTFITNVPPDGTYV